MFFRNGSVRRAVRLAGSIAAISVAGLNLGGCIFDTPIGPIRILPNPTNPGGLARPCGSVNIEGRVYDLLDTNGDGVCDTIRDPATGRTYPFEFLPQGMEGISIGEPDRVYSMQEFEPFLTAAPESPRLKPPEGSAAKNLASIGLLESSAPMTLRSNLGMTIHTFDPSSQQIDVSFGWSTAFHLPDVRDYPQIASEQYIISGDSPLEPGYVSMRLVGPVDRVAAYLAAMGVESMSIPGPSSITFDIEFSRNDKIATIKADGATVAEFNLNQ